MLYDLDREASVLGDDPLLRHHGRQLAITS
jgi:hypothetical protein